ncbi:TetR family transcriptional regulator [Nocardiopsis sp. Huas11]|uniref:TetR/AcrR family transcriptional regulator n=1 Tax=Nocardiopsis sp. Huas11 TaxID=2183912 RepID=UPI000EB17687|nr:TetR/AcrR family transcriptional regulator [Nocardiopsis sp. Huas11]RKS07917.1 TetR family transcriptional regulator [Nocardiopsis sp. Huas11]
MTTSQVPAPPAGTSAPTRRERVREATLLEIKETARRHLVEFGPAGVSLRAVAREMGMTAPGLYRYVPGIDALLVAVTADLFDELASAVAAADASVPDHDTDQRILSSLRAFRTWAVGHRAEFAIMFGPRRAPEADISPAVAAGRRFGATFFTLFDRLLAERRFPLPDDESVPADLARELRSFASTCGTDADRVPVTAIKVLASCWVRLYGVVCMEVFEHMHFAMTDMNPLFEAELHDVLTELGVRYTPPGDEDEAAAHSSESSD